MCLGSGGGGLASQEGIITVDCDVFPAAAMDGTGSFRGTTCFCSILQLFLVLRMIIKVIVIIITPDLCFAPVPVIPFHGASVIKTRLVR